MNKLKFQVHLPTLLIYDPWFTSQDLVWRHRFSAGVDYHPSFISLRYI